MTSRIDWKLSNRVFNLDRIISQSFSPSSTERFSATYSRCILKGGSCVNGTCQFGEDNASMAVFLSLQTGPLISRGLLDHVLVWEGEYQGTGLADI